jgi:hypothetical protein
MLAPALEQLRASLSGLRLDKWKAPGAVREETDANIGSITRDMTGTLPNLLATADAAPGVLSKNLSVFRNVDALYDVLLRVVETADLSAPEHEANILHQALASLDGARRSLGDAMESVATSQEQELVRLRTQVQPQAEAATAAHPVTPTVVTDDEKKAVPKHKHRVVKPAAAQPAAQPQN